MDAIIKQTTNTKALSITVDDGMEAVPITNKFGREIGVFYFRPTDINIVERYNEIVPKVTEVFKPLEDIGVKPDGTADGDEQAQAVLKESEARLYELCDYLFDGNLSEAFFGSMNPFSPLSNGSFYCEEALTVVGNFIATQFNKSVKSIEKRITKYTKNYASKSGAHRPS